MPSPPALVEGVATDKRPLTLQSRSGPRVNRDVCGGIRRGSVLGGNEVQVRHVVSERLGTAKAKWAKRIKLTGDTVVVVVVVPVYVRPFAPLSCTVASSHSSKTQT